LHDVAAGFFEPQGKRRSEIGISKGNEDWHRIGFLSRQRFSQAWQQEVRAAVTQLLTRDGLLYACAPLA
jgi:hypothetical protein